MVKKKNEPQLVWLRQMLERSNSEHPVVEVKWSVEEVTPGYNTGGYYDVDVPEEFVMVSDFLETKEEAEAWMDEHEADEGKRLAIRKHVAREHTHINWTSVRIRD